MRLRASALLAASVILGLAACSSGPNGGPAASHVAVDHTQQATIDGEWIITRTVTKSDDKLDPAKAIGAISLRYLLFANVSCPSGPCTGVVQSGPTTNVRDKTTFSSSGNLISYDFSGTVNCLSPTDGTVLVQDGFTFHSHGELKPQNPSPGSSATALTGSLVYTDTVTNAALAAGCTRDPVTETTEYSLSAVRADAVPKSSTATPSPSP